MSFYTSFPRLTLGFHGCSVETQQEVLLGKCDLQPSYNDYDWLGGGVYFWENDPIRAFEWAERSKKFDEPAVIGAIISLGRCLNLCERYAIKSLQTAFESFKAMITEDNKELPINIIEKSGDVLRRPLDCAVINYLHGMRDAAKLPPYDSVIGHFAEGGAAFPGATFTEMMHTQICVTNSDCIKGYFLPKMEGRSI